MPWFTFQRHDRIGNARGSKSTRIPISEALERELAFRTTTPSSTTVEYSVSFLECDSGICSHPAGGVGAYSAVALEEADRIFDRRGRRGRSSEGELALQRLADGDTCRFRPSRVSYPVVA